MNLHLSDVMLERAFLTTSIGYFLDFILRNFPPFSFFLDPCLFFGRVICHVSLVHFVYLNNKWAFACDGNLNSLVQSTKFTIRYRGLVPRKQYTGVILRLVSIIQTNVAQTDHFGFQTYNQLQKWSVMVSETSLSLNFFICSTD